MTKDKARLAVMGAISMALEDPTLQQGFEIICKNLVELEALEAETQLKLLQMEELINEQDKEIRLLRQDMDILERGYE